MGRGRCCWYCSRIEKFGWKLSESSNINTRQDISKETVSFVIIKAATSNLAFRRIFQHFGHDGGSHRTADPRWRSQRLEMESSQVSYWHVRWSFLIVWNRLEVLSLIHTFLQDNGLDQIARAIDTLMKQRNMTLPEWVGVIFVSKIWSTFFWQSENIYTGNVAWSRIGVWVWCDRLHASRSDELNIWCSC